MSQQKNLLFKVLYIIAWIIFIGVCIEAGGFIFNAVFTLFVNPEGTTKFWKEVDLSALYRYSESRYVTLVSLMIIVALLRCILFYMIIKIIHDRKITFAQPFSNMTKKFISNTAWLVLGIGLFSFWGSKVAEQLSSENVKMPGIQYLRLAGADVWLFMGVTLLVIAEIFKKGIEIQTENELTV